MSSRNSQLRPVDLKVKGKNQRAKSYQSSYLERIPSVYEQGSGLNLFVWQANENLNRLLGNAGSGFSSILDSLRSKSREGLSTYKPTTSSVIKCSCGSVWCPSCYKRNKVPILNEKINTFDWQRTRTVTLTIDRALYKTGLEALEAVHEKKLIPGFIRNLIRGKKPFRKVAVTKWLWALEWHRDGFPHWHILIEVEDRGMAGQIGQSMLHHYWKQGRILNEGYFKNKSHFDKIAGYYGKQGYFEKGKGYQSELPLHIQQEAKRKIRRNSYVNVNERKITERKQKEMTIEEGEMKMSAETITADRLMNTLNRLYQEEIDNDKATTKRRTYEVIINGCGQKSMMCLDFGMMQITGIVDLSYDLAKKLVSGEYIQGKGYCGEINFESTLRIIAKMDKLIAVAFNGDGNFATIYRKANNMKEVA